MLKIIGLLLVVMVSLGLMQIAGCKPPDKKDKKKQKEEVKDDELDKVSKNGPKVKIEEVKKGTGPAAKKGDTVYVHFTGKLKADGTQFDSSKGKAPLKFTIGRPGIIQGWHDGIAGMKVGGKRKLTIPPELGYQERGKGSIPPNATLIFDIELLKIQKEEE